MAETPSPNPELSSQERVADFFKQVSRLMENEKFSGDRILQIKAGERFGLVLGLPDGSQILSAQFLDNGSEFILGQIRKFENPHASESS